jgi:transposase
MRWGGRPSGRPPLILRLLSEPIEFARVEGSRRCDQLAANYLAFIQLASIRLWLCVKASTL